MNKSKQLREQIEASITGTFNRLVFAEKKNGKQNYCVHDDIDNCMDTIEEIRESVRNIVNYALKAQKSELLEEVRSIIGEDEKEGEHDRCSTDEDIYCYSCQKGIEEGSVDHFRAGRNDFRAELRQKLSILEGKK